MHLGRAAWTVAALAALCACSAPETDADPPKPPERTGSVVSPIVYTGQEITASPYQGGIVVVLGQGASWNDYGNPSPGIGAMHYPRTRHTATVLADATVLVAGGFRGHVISNAERLLAAGGGSAWVHASHMVTPRQWHAATLLANGRVLVAGGDDGSGHALAAAEVCNPGSPGPTSPVSTWSTVAPMAAGRRWHTATRLPSGRVLVVGGDDGSGPLASAEIYDPATATWAGAAPLSVARRWHTATRLPSGSVLVTGGDGGSGPLASAEIYDPAAATWSAAAPMSAARSRHREVLRPDGTLLVTGGDGVSGALASTETYQPTTGLWLPGPTMQAPRAGHAIGLNSRGWALIQDSSSLESLKFGATALGAACGADTDCDSGFCVSGVCCDKACPSGQCLVCPAGSGVCAPDLAAQGTYCSDLCVTGACFGGSCVPGTGGSGPGGGVTQCLANYAQCGTSLSVGSCTPGRGCVNYPAPDDVLCHTASNTTHTASFGGYVSTSNPGSSNACFFSPTTANCFLRLGAGCLQSSPQACASGHCSSENVCCNSPCTALGMTCTIAGGAPDDGVCTPIEGAPCDANPCALGGTWQSGVCLGGVAQSDGTPCDDGNPCTLMDACQAGTCTGSSSPCSPLDACHMATCDPTTGLCSSPPQPNGTPCDDGNPCTLGDACHAGACAGTPATCSAADICHIAGSCDPATGACTNPQKPDGASCDDGNACTQVDACVGGSCVGSAPVICAALDACHVAGACDPGTGACSSPAQPDGTRCDDGDACTTADSCQTGVCQGATVTCAPLDACHSAGVCNPVTGCSQPAQPDGTLCAGGACAGGVCIPPPDAGTSLDAGMGGGSTSGAAVSSSGGMTGSGGATAVSSSGGMTGSGGATAVSSSGGMTGSGGATVSSSGGATGTGGATVSSSGGTGGSEGVATGSSGVPPLTAGGGCQCDLSAESGAPSTGLRWLALLVVGMAARTRASRWRGP